MTVSHTKDTTTTMSLHSSRARPVAVSALALLTAIGLAACAGPSSSTLTVDDSPLAPYLAAIQSGNSAEFRDQVHREREELTAECMADEGWEYLPVEPSPMIGTIDYSSDDYQPDNREWVESWGYGVISWPGFDEAVEATNEWIDPNVEIWATLSEVETNAYILAMYGTDPAGDPDDRAVVGCYGWAGGQVTYDDPRITGEFAPLLDEISALGDEHARDPALADLDREWSACMERAGEGGFTTALDPHMTVSDWYAEAIDHIDFTAGLDDPRLRALQQKEIALALIDLDCRESIDYRARQLELQFALEARFVDDNRTQLDALKAALDEGGA